MPHAYLHQRPPDSTQAARYYARQWLEELMRTLASVVRGRIVACSAPPRRPHQTTRTISSDMSKRGRLRLHRHSTRTTPATATRSSAPLRNMSCTSVRSQGWLRLGRARPWRAKIALGCATFTRERYSRFNPRACPCLRVRAACALRCRKNSEHRRLRTAS
jgi:hypothetical protein